eukprot:TRINITY_DN1255_c0_g1_i1.p1 TRINITY_DN1255_c0_g1~~TRINITY_DN1255_c0_g1_i1.p1  ORF type:complete len:530 (-),score=118.48 TRINITY_DN1255_c0_g1_i1:10-1599(-)
MLPLVKPVSKRTSLSNGHSHSHHHLLAKASNAKWLLLALVVLAWLGVTMTLLPAGLGSEKPDVILALGETGEEAAAPAGQARPPEAKRPPEKQTPAPALTLEQIHGRLTSFLRELHDKYAALDPGPKPTDVWEMYKDSADRWLLPLDRDYAGVGLFPVREDDSIFVSIASYRDENCPNTIKDMYAKADKPERVFVGLVQQNCVANCRSGVLEGGRVEDIEPDIDCYETFCESEQGKGRCGQDGQLPQVRHLFVNESESLGPAVARYFASKLWHGENYFMQIDSHSQFVSGWDSFPVTDMKNTPSYPYSALTHYPPSVDWPNYDEPAHRICGAKFADSDIESQIVRLTVTARFEREFQTVPCRAPFIGAGYVFAHASFLAVMPFDPYVPWVFMGEEILFSLRLHTWGYDIYSPTHNTASHIYVREHKPKFWETVGRLFQQDGIHNAIQGYIINRPKYIIGYPESSSEQVDATLLAHSRLYGEGPTRPLAEYMAMVGLDPVAKEATGIDWCVKCEAPRPVIPFELLPQAVQ